MPELTPEDRRTALNFANALEFMAAGIHNDFVRKNTRRLVRQIRGRYGFSHTDKKEWIVKIVRDLGGASATDLVLKTGWSRPEIVGITRELRDERQLRVERVAPAGGGRGRHAVLFFAGD